MIPPEQAVAIAREYILCNYPDCVEDNPEVFHFPAELRPDNWLNNDAWLVTFPWKPVEGLERSSRGCSILVDMESGELLLPQ